MPRAPKNDHMPKGVRPGPPARDGSARWYVRWIRNGKEHKYLIPASTKWAAAEELERLRSTQTLPGRSRQLDRCIELYREERPDTNTRLIDDPYLARLCQGFSNRSVGSISTAELQHWLKSVRQQNGQPYAPNTLLSIRRAVSSFFSWALSEGHIQTNPALGLPPIKRRASAARVTKKHLTVDELHQLFAFWSELPEPYPLMYRTQLRLGVRAGEVLGLHRDCINWDTGTVEIIQQVTKSKIVPPKDPTKTQIKYLSEQGRTELRAYVDTHPAREGLVFSNPHNGPAFYSYTQFNQYFRCGLEDCGIQLAPKTTTHAFRHCWSHIAHHFVESIGSAEIAEILGNTPSVAEKHYMSAQQRQPSHATKQIAEYLETVVFSDVTKSSEEEK